MAAEFRGCWKPMLARMKNPPSLAGCSWNSDALCLERNASDWLPFLENFSFSCCPVSQVGERHNERLNAENHRGVVGEVDVNAVVARFGGEFDAFDDLALGFGKACGTCVLFWRLFTLVFSHFVQSFCMSG